MKKVITLFTCLMLSALSMYAQELYGTWKTTTEEKGQRITLLLNFADETHLRAKISCHVNAEEFGEIDFLINMAGTYKRHKKDLTLNIDPATSNLSVEKTKWKGELAEAIKNNPELEKTLKSTIKLGMEKAKVEISKDMPLEGTAKIISLTATELKLQDEASNEIHSFTRVSQ